MKSLAGGVYHRNIMTISASSTFYTLAEPLSLSGDIRFRQAALTSDTIHLAWAVNFPVTGAVKQPVSEIELLSGLRGRI